MRAAIDRRAAHPVEAGGAPDRAWAHSSRRRQNAGNDPPRSRSERSNRATGGTPAARQGHRAPHAGRGTGRGAAVSDTNVEPGARPVRTGGHRVPSDHAETQRAPTPLPSRVMGLGAPEPRRSRPESPRAPLGSRATRREGPSSTPRPHLGECRGMSFPAGPAAAAPARPRRKGRWPRDRSSRLMSTTRPNRPGSPGQSPRETKRPGRSVAPEQRNPDASRLMYQNVRKGQSPVGSPSSSPPGSPLRPSRPPIGPDAGSRPIACRLSARGTSGFRLGS